MPIQMSVEKFSDGRKYLRSVSTGVVTGDDAQVLMKRIGPGTELEGLSLLAIMEGKVDLQPEARKIFASLNNTPTAKKMKVAVVTSSAPLRVTMSFILRIAGQADATKFFGSEAEARTWLEANAQ